MDINIFTAALRTEFIKSMDAVPEGELNWKKYTQVIPSTARIENYPWMAPPPRLSRYLGHRRYTQLDQIKYTVANVEYDAGLTVSTRDVDDDQVGGYMIRVGELGAEAAQFPGIAVVRDALANAGSLPCFDGSNFFATSHNVGTYPSAPAGFGGGGNALTFTSTNTSDAATYKMIFLIHKNKLKPLLWQNRKAPKINTTAGTPQSIEAKEAHYFIDMEGAPAFGYWWDALQITITNTPSINDMFTCFDAAYKTFYQFALPAALTTDPTLYVHQGLQFTSENCTILCSTGLFALLRHALYEDRVGVSVANSTSGITSNIYYNNFGLETSPYLN